MPVLGMVVMQDRSEPDRPSRKDRGLAREPVGLLCAMRSTSRIALLTVMPLATTIPRIETVEKF
jgi:hypothetical protein